MDRTNARFTLTISGDRFTEMHISRTAELFCLMGQIAGPKSVLTGFSDTKIEVEEAAPGSARERSGAIDGVTVSRDVLEEALEVLESNDPSAEVIEEIRAALGQ